MSRLQKLLDELQELEARVREEIDRDAAKLGYKIQQGRIYFESEVVQRHKAMAISIHHYLTRASWRAILTAPIIYSLILPLLLLDLFVYCYQFICFPIYGIPRIKRHPYFVFDRHQLRYLNPIERVHCYYCSYANGLLAYSVEVGARTEQYWCPIKHARHPSGSHGRYYNFVPYGDAEAYQKNLKMLRDKLKTSESAEPM